MMMTIMTMTMMLLASLAAANSPCRLLAIGDIHGDLENAQSALRQARLIDAEGKWIGGCSILVQTGDIVDRGDASLQALDYFKNLCEEAVQHGGEVRRLLGNHELMNFMGDFRYVSKREMDNNGGEANWKRLFSPGGPYRSWLENLDIATVVNNTVFVHAGITSSYAALGVKGINRIAKSRIKKANYDASILGDGGPLWTRHVIFRAMEQNCRDLELSLSLLGVERMVVGHTIDGANNIREYCGGQLVSIDVAISRAIIGLHPQCAEFTADGKVLAHHGAVRVGSV